jgi:hypothetical protein
VDAQPAKILYPLLQVAHRPKEHDSSDKYDEEQELDLRVSAPHMHLPTRDPTLSALGSGHRMDRAGSMLLGGRHMHRDCRMLIDWRRMHRAFSRVPGEHHMHRARGIIFLHHCSFM